MRILLIHQYFLLNGEGGGGRWNEMTRRWAALGDEITVLTGSHHYLRENACRKRTNWFSTYTMDDGTEVILCPTYRGTKGRFFAMRMLEYLSFVLSAVFYIIVKDKKTYDCLVATSPPLTVALVTMLISWWKKCPYIAEVRDLWPESAIEMGVLKNRHMVKLAYRIEKWYYHFSQKIVVLTPAFKTYLIEQKRILPAKIHYVPNAVDFQLAEEALKIGDSQSLREELKLTNRFVVIYVGAHGKANGLEQLVEIATHFIGTNVYFLCIGDGDQKLLLQHRVKKMQLDNFGFLDLLDKRTVLRYICMADIGVTILQQKDIFKTIYSNKTFDYFSCQKPVLMSVDGISRALIEEAEAGRYVDSLDPDSWIEAIGFYQQNASIREQHGKNGYQFAQKHFDRNYWAMYYRTIL